MSSSVFCTSYAVQVIERRMREQSQSRRQLEAPGDSARLSLYRDLPPPAPVRTPQFTWSACLG